MLLLPTPNAAAASRSRCCWHPPQRAWKPDTSLKDRSRRARGNWGTRWGPKPEIFLNSKPKMHIEPGTAWKCLLIYDLSVKYSQNILVEFLDSPCLSLVTTDLPEQLVGQSENKVRTRTQRKDTAKRNLNWLTEQKLSEVAGRADSSIIAVAGLGKVTRLVLQF